MKVLLAISSLHRGGAERQLVELVARLDRERYQPLLALCDPTDEFGVALPPERIFDLRAARGSTPLTFARLVRILRRERPTIVHTFGGLLNLYGRLAVRATGIGRHLSAVRAGIPYPRDLRNEALTWRLTDAIVTNSVGTRDVLITRARIPPQRIEVIENGVDSQRFVPLDATARSAVRARLGMRGVTVLLPARLAEEKNHLGALAAMALLRDAGRLPAGFSLWFVGRIDPGPLADRLHAALRRHGLGEAVRCLGPTDAMPELLAAADAILLPSHFEGMPNVVLEALACGTPALVSPAANRDAIVHHGVHGLTLASSRAEDIAEGLRAIAVMDDDTRRAMGQQGRQRVLEAFTLERMVARTCALYDALAGRGAEGARSQAAGSSR
jgi:glycosyltransferase involved in cell wall biosynthesis